MGEILGGLVRGISRVGYAIVDGWSRLSDNDRIVGTIAGGLVLGGLLMPGILGAGAAFAVSMVVSLGLLVLMVPPIAKALIKYRVIADWSIAFFALWAGFVSGSATLAVGMTFFGLCITTLLRVGKAVEDLIPGTFDWGQIAPVGVWKLFRKPTPDSPTIINVAPLPQAGN